MFTHKIFTCHTISETWHLITPEAHTSLQSHTLILSLWLSFQFHKTLFATFCIHTILYNTQEEVSWFPFSNKTNQNATLIHQCLIRTHHMCKHSLFYWTPTNHGFRRGLHIYTTTTHGWCIYFISFCVILYSQPWILRLQFKKCF